MDVKRVSSNVFPRFYPSLPSTGAPDIKLSHEQSPVSRRFLSDLLIFYAYDLGDQFEMVSYGELERLGLSAEDLHDVALTNFRRLNLKIEAHRGPHVTMLTAGGNFEATLLLDDGVWDAVAGMVDGDLIASAPARDIILFCGSAPESIAALRHCTSHSLEHSDKPLSRCFFKRVAGSWTEYDGFAA